jgi:uncharacterized protein YegP (UPF0339 family)
MVRFQLRRAIGGFYFRIRARNGKTLAHSEVYRQRRSARRAITLIGGPDAIVEDET